MTPSPSDRRARGIAMRQARIARVSGIRHRVVASALALFVATWLLITILLVSGHDPALARTKTVATAARSATTTSTSTTSPPTTRTSGTTTSTPATRTTSTTAASSPSSSSSSSSPTALTSSQS